MEMGVCQFRLQYGASMTEKQVRQIKYIANCEKILAKKQAERDLIKAEKGKQSDKYEYVKKPSGKTYRIKKAIKESK